MNTENMIVIITGEDEISTICKTNNKLIDIRFISGNKEIGKWIQIKALYELLFNETK